MLGIMHVSKRCEGLGREGLGILFIGLVEWAPLRRSKVKGGSDVRRFHRLGVQTSSIDLYNDILSTHLPEPRGFPFFLVHQARVANLCMEVISVYRLNQDWRHGCGMHKA